jgi:hypothetical protein
LVAMATCVVQLIIYQKNEPQVDKSSAKIAEASKGGEAIEQI